MPEWGPPGLNSTGPTQGGLSDSRPPGSARSSNRHPQLPPGDVPMEGCSCSECKFHLSRWNVLWGGRGKGSLVLGLPSAWPRCHGVEAPGWAGGWPVITQSVLASPPWAQRAGDVSRTAACPWDLLAWKENTGRCGQADTAAVCLGAGVPGWRELTDRTFCHLPALFQNSLPWLGLAASGGRGLSVRTRAGASRASGH